MIDRQKAESLIERIEKYYSILTEFKKLTLEEYLKDIKTVYSSRYLIQVCVESCINLSNHIIASNKMGVPSEYADTFRILCKNNLIDEKLAAQLINMTRFRNRLVHLYWDIDDEFLFEIINNNLEDINAFIKSIKQYLKLLKL